jgi:hypothetical protein
VNNTVRSNNSSSNSDNSISNSNYSISDRNDSASSNSSSKNIGDNVNTCSACSGESTCRCLNKNKSDVYTNDGILIKDLPKNEDEIQVIDNSDTNGKIDDEFKTRKPIENGDYVELSASSNGTNIHRDNSKLSVKTDFIGENCMHVDNMNNDNDDFQIISDDTKLNLMGSTDLNTDRNTYLTDLFLGSLENTVQCLECSHVSRKFEPVFELLLDISRAGTLLSALSEYCRTEKLFGGNAYEVYTYSYITYICDVFI